MGAASLRCRSHPGWAWFGCTRPGVGRARRGLCLVDSSSFLPPLQASCTPRHLPPPLITTSNIFTGTASPTSSSAHPLHRWLQEGYGAHAVLHFGMHGTVEWLPGTSLGNSGLSWPDVLLGEPPACSPTCCLRCSHQHTHRLSLFLPLIGQLCWVSPV